MRRKNTAKGCTDIKGMALGIQRRVCHLADAADDDIIERTLRIEVRTAAALDWAIVA